MEIIGAIIQLQAAALITMFTDIKGLKGRLFFFANMDCNYSS